MSLPLTLDFPRIHIFLAPPKSPRYHLRPRLILSLCLAFQGVYPESREMSCEVQPTAYRSCFSTPHMSFSCNSTPRSVPCMGLSFLLPSRKSFWVPRARLFPLSLSLGACALFDLEMLRFPKRKIYLLPVSNRKQPLAVIGKIWRRRGGKLCPPLLLSCPIFHKVSLINDGSDSTLEERPNAKTVLSD